MNAAEGTIRRDIPGATWGLSSKGDFSGDICRLPREKLPTHLNRPRLVDEKRGYRPDADASQLDTRLSAKCPRVHVVDYDSFVHV